MSAKLLRFSDSYGKPVYVGAETVSGLYITRYGNIAIERRGMSTVYLDRKYVIDDIAMDIEHWRESNETDLHQ